MGIFAFGKSQDPCYEKTMKLARMGWIKVDTKNEKLICSEFIRDLLGLKSCSIPYPDFFRLIPSPFYEPLRTKIFQLEHYSDSFEMTVPLEIALEKIWVHIHFGDFDKNTRTASGYIQYAPNQELYNGNKRYMEEISSLLHYLNSIPNSMFSFIKEHNTDEILSKLLKDILGHLNANRTFIFKYDWEKQTQSCLYEESDISAKSNKDKQQDIPLDRFPLLFNQLTQNRPIIFSSPHNTSSPSEYDLEILEILDYREITSLIIVPMMGKSKIWGYMGIEIKNREHKWSHIEYHWLSSLANVIGICLELRRSEREAIREKKYLQDLYDHMPIGYCRLRIFMDENGEINDYIILEYNKSAAILTDSYAPKFDQSKRGSEFDTEFDKRLQVFRKARHLKTFSVPEFQLPGNPRNFGATFYFTGEDEIVILFSDITELVKAHKALNCREKQLRDIYNNIPVGIELYDPQGNLIDTNHKNLEIFGVEEKEAVLGRNLFKHLNLSEVYKNTLRNGKGFELVENYDFSEVSYKTARTGVIERSTSATLVYDDDQKLSYYLLINIDNTEKKIAYNRISDFENLFSAIGDFAKVGYCKWNAVTNEGFAISQWYKNIEEKAGTPINEIIGIYRHLHPDDRTVLNEMVHRLLKGEIRQIRRHSRIMTGENTHKWIHQHIMLTEFDPDQNRIELIGVNIDITEQKENEIQLIGAKEKAEGLDKMKSAFIANMSHEIRTPLNAIVGFSNLLTETGDTEERELYISIIKKNNDLLLQLISDILDLSSIEGQSLNLIYEPVNISVLFNEIIYSFSMKNERNLEICLETESSSLSIHTDRHRLTQLITNLLNNALKFTASGRITIGQRTNENNEVEIWVEDTGCGIPKEKLEAVFERFVKLDSFVPGTGLGLSICRSIVEQMKGRIWVESEPGVGTRFSFTLPSFKSEDQRNDVPELKKTVQTEKPYAGNPFKRKKILVAEDIDSNFLLIRTILQKEYDLIRAYNGREAVELHRSENPDLILMDIKMPVMGGFEATGLIRETDSKTPVIALTAFAFDADKQKAEDAGCDGHLSKPVSSKVLKEMIRDLIKKKNE